MAARETGILLVGGGLAAATCASELRELGYDGRVLLCGREPDAPYHRPPCSKEYLRGEEQRSDTLVHPEGWWDEHDVELLTRTSVTKLDLDAKVATLSTREEVRFERVLLATGA